MDYCSIITKLYRPAESGQVSVRNPLPEKPFTSGAYLRPSSKTGQVLVRTPGGQRPEFQPEKGATSGVLKFLTRLETTIDESMRVRTAL